MKNMNLYEAFRSVPESAKRAINAGRLKGKTDINPMWRIKALTEQFGPCGSGWRYEIVRKEIVPGANNEAAAFVDINLYYRQEESGNEWSAPIPGTGGSMFVTKESKGLYTSDECYKMALTDAISVAAKALGIGADVYWDKDATKYTGRGKEEDSPLCSSCHKVINSIALKDGRRMNPQDVANYSSRRFGTVLCSACMKGLENENPG